MDHSKQSVPYETFQDDTDPPSYTGEPSQPAQNQQIYLPTTVPQMVQMSTPSRRFETYPHITSKALGSIQIICGILSIAFSVIAIIENNYAIAVASTGIWTGCLFIIAGGFGIGAAIHKNMCQIVTFMVMSIIAAIVAGMMLLNAALSIVHLVAYCESHGDPGMDHCHKVVFRVIVGLLVTVALLEMVVAIASAITCCRSVCCGRGATNQSSVIQYYPQADGRQQVIYVMAAPGNAQPFNIPQQAAPHTG